MKGQTVRLIDVFFLGPVMIWGGMQLTDPAARAILIAAGGATIAYNWQNYTRGGFVPHRHTIDNPEGSAYESRTLV